MKRLMVLAVVSGIAVVVLGLGLMQRLDGVQAQNTNAPILVLEVRSWVEADVDPTSWQWQALEDGSLHVGFYSPGELTCVDITVPAGVTATYSGPDEPNAIVAGPSESITMCEAVFTRVNG